MQYQRSGVLCWFLGISGGHVWHRVRKTQAGRRPGAQKREEEERYFLWQRATARAEDKDDEERQEVTTLTADETTNTVSYGRRRESLVDLIAICDD